MNNEYITSKSGKKYYLSSNVLDKLNLKKRKKSELLSIFELFLENINDIITIMTTNKRSDLINIIKAIGNKDDLRSINSNDLRDICLMLFIEDLIKDI